MLLVKKYPNRRLYDTRHSRYITLDDLEKMVRTGEDVAVQDAQDGRDLTQETLTQIILDRGGGRILPAALLLRLIRLDDDSLGEFLTRYVSWALEVYLQARGGAQALLPLNPLAMAPFAATDAISRLVMGATNWARPAAARGRPPSDPPGFTPDPMPMHDGMMPMAPPPPPPSASAMPVPAAPDSTPASSRAPSGATEIGDEMLRLRREIEALKESLGGVAAAASAASASAKARSPKKPKKKSPKRA